MGSRRGRITLQALYQSNHIGLKQQRGILPEHADTAGVLQQLQAYAVGKQGRIFAQGVFCVQPVMMDLPVWLYVGWSP
ncbi:hypothetical protein LP416_31100 [Polaromonas sp. P2-4]|nr:hypothetical protein LP416_31100 [Polaromonas sp. P2-4]